MKPATVVTLIGSLFFFAGLLFLGIAAGFALYSRAFLANAVATEGTVIGWREQAVVRFTGPRGPVEFRATNFSSDYHVGQNVPVLYRATDPQDASINSFSELWLLPVMLAAIATPGTLVGAGILTYRLRRRAIKRTLLSSGTPILTDFQRVARDTSLTVNGRSPFVIYTQWQNPATSQIEVFKSEGLWSDPSNSINPKHKITVLVDPEKPRHYYVDLGFLTQQRG